ncbi:hypothetical protein [Dictyobacter arantiisoli]|uniref:Uncharacterized protein n=1 Tax=Dictyobacter arantiisoli TaxID=2014874 RepID=A0A5A5T5T2_9CHLR|nr:hypothetical protein [Dictyobacter arantiisoli]GCF06790.1 hypothetical protein KDI_03540 [Dictyobacter arantiisoli]
MAIKEFGNTASEVVHVTPEQALLEQQKEIMAYGLQTITEKIEKKKSPFLERHAWGWRYEQLATHLKGEIRTIKGEIRDNRQLKETVYDDIQKIKDLISRPDVPRDDKATARALETYYQNVNTEKITRAEVDTRRVAFLEVYDRCIMTPDKIAALRNDPINGQLTPAQRTLANTLHTRYTTDGRLDHINHNQLETLHQQYVEHPRWLTDLRQLDALPTTQHQQLDRITNNFENNQQLDMADRARLQELTNNYSGTIAKLHELSQNPAIIEGDRQRFKNTLERKEYLQFDQNDRDSLDLYYDHEITQRNMLQELSEIGHLPADNRQEVEALRDAYIADEANRLGDINDPQRMQLQNLYDHFAIPKKQLEALESKQHRLLITDSLALEACKAEFELNGNIAELDELHERNVLILDQLETLHKIIPQKSPQAGEVSTLSKTFWNTSDLSPAERTRLQEIYDNHITIPEQLEALNKLSSMTYADTQKLTHFEQLQQLTIQEHTEFTALHQKYVAEQRPNVPLAEQAAIERMNILQKLALQIKGAETTLGAKENDLREKQNKLVHGSPWVARKFYEWRTRDVRSTLESELATIVNGERRNQTLPEAIKIVLLQLTSDTNKNKLKEIATAEAKVIEHMTNAQKNLEIIRQQKQQRDDAQIALTSAIRAEVPEAHEDLMRRVETIKQIETNINYARKGYFRELNDPMLIHDFQNYQKALYKNIYGPAKNAILTMYKINGLINIMGATEAYLATLGQVADARNSLLSKMVHLTGRGIENIPAGFSGGVGANIVKGVFTPYTTPTR